MPPVTYPNERTGAMSVMGGQTGGGPIGQVNYAAGGMQQPIQQQQPQVQTGMSMLANTIQQQSQTAQQMSSQMGQLPQVQQPKAPGGQRSLQDIASTLAESYGIPLGRQPLVDEQGNFTRMPTNANEAARFNYIAQAIADEQNRRQQALATGALQTELGLVQRRGRGSLASLMSGSYRALAEQYSNQKTEAADFSYFIQEEFLRRQEEMQARALRAQKKKSKWGKIGSIVGAIGGTLLGGPGMGTSIGATLGGTLGGELSF